MAIAFTLLSFTLHLAADAPTRSACGRVRAMWLMQAHAAQGA